MSPSFVKTILFAFLSIFSLGSIVECDAAPAFGLKKIYRDFRVGDENAEDVREDHTSNEDNIIRDLISIIWFKSIPFHVAPAFGMQELYRDCSVDDNSSRKNKNLAVLGQEHHDAKQTTRVMDKHSQFRNLRGGENGVNPDVLEAIKIEYRNMASWYDDYWESYTRETLKLPLDIVKTELLQHPGPHSQKQLACQVIVDVACGTGEFLRRLQKEARTWSQRQQQFRLWGMEPSREMLEQAQKKFNVTYPRQSPSQENDSSSETTRSPTVSLRQSSAEHIDLPSSTANIVMCTSAFHFFRDKPQALKEMKRVLLSQNGTKFGAPTGMIVITDWCNDYWMVRCYYWMQKVRWWWRRKTSGIGVQRPQTDTPQSPSSSLSSKPNNEGQEPSLGYPGPLTSSELFQLVQDAGFTDITLRRYLVRVFGILPWAMQTVTAKKR